MLFHTIPEILLYAKKTYGADDAIRWKKSKNEIESRTYSELKNDTDSFANAIEKLGKKGQHIAVIGPSSYEWIVSYLAITESGSVAVPIDASLPAADICELLDRADVRMLIFDEARSDVAEAAAKSCHDINVYVSMNSTEHCPQVLSFNGLIDDNRGSYEPAVAEDALCTIMFTSGTTGKSKGVMLTQNNLAENATCLDMKIGPHTVILSVLPIHHAYCLSMDILKGISLGSVICINDSIMRMAKNIQLFTPDMILMVPLMIETFARKLEEVRAAGLPAEPVRKKIFGERLHTICSGGAYLNPDYVDLFAEFGITILQGYGMTECSPVISTNLSWDIRKNSVGKLMPNCEAKTVDGELLVRGTSVMQGYYKMPKETEETLSDGWLHTGDLGYVDEDGYIYLTGRRKNLIITKNGENVSPEELENALSVNHLIKEIIVRESEGVIEAEIFPDSEYAQNTGIADIRAALQELIDEYNVNVPAYKRIYSLKVRESEFEKTASRKIKRS